MRQTHEAVCSEPVSDGDYDDIGILRDEVVAIVLDRGVLGNDIDLLVPNANVATQSIGRSKITYDVLRNGWHR